MTWRDQMLAKVLLILAKLFVDDPQIAEDLKHLGNRISVDGTREREKALAAAGLLGD